MKIEIKRRKLRDFYSAPAIKAREVGRERPLLYRGLFSVPKQVVARLSTSKSQLLLAEGSVLNIKVDLLYLAVDNVLSAAIVAKESSLTTKVHQKKIDKFFKHFSAQAKSRAIEKADFLRFYNLWLKSRYELYVPSWKEVKEMEMFTTHVYDVTATAIARSFRSDKSIMAKKIDDSVHLYKSESIHEIAGWIHEQHQFEAEEAGEMYGGKLARKFLNPWNYMAVLLVTDQKQIRDVIDKSDDMQKHLKNLLDSWDGIVNTTMTDNLTRLAAEIAAHKVRKGKGKEEAAEQALRAAQSHPGLLKFRLGLNLVFDSSEPRETLEMWGRSLDYSRELSSRPRSAMKDAWEILKAYKRK